MREKKSPFEGRVPALKALRVFEAAARHESFTAAAAELHVTHGAVSRQIRQLEDSLNIPLFERRNRAVHLTAAGTELFAGCSEAMSRLGETLRRLQAPDVRAPLVVSCEPTVAMRWLIPRLPAFRTRFPNHQLHLLTAGGHVDFARDRVDVALRRNDFNWRDGDQAERIAPELMGPVCSPEVAAHLSKRGSRAGGVIPMLHTRTRPKAWATWLDATGHNFDRVDAGQFEHFYLCLQAAVSGLGVALGSAYMVEDDIRDGRLVAPFGFTPDGSEYMLLSPVPVDSDERRSLFLDWMRHEMAKSRVGLE